MISAVKLFLYKPLGDAARDCCIR